MADKVKEVASEEAERISALTREAARSGAYLYPLKGIAYFISHRSLWRPLTSKLAPTLTLGIGVTTFMFVFTYVPQAAIMAFTSGPIAALSAALLVLSESSTVLNMLSKTFLIEDAVIDTFDGTLMLRDCSSLVSEGRQIKAGSDPVYKMGKLLKKPFVKFTPQAIIRYFMYLPLNFIPVVGTFFFIILQGKRFGPTAHARYFQLKEWPRSRQDKWIEQNRGAYTSFGILATLLEMIPFANLFFTFTNTVGAALWAADVERKSTLAPNLREQARKAE